MEGGAAAAFRTRVVGLFLGVLKVTAVNEPSGRSSLSWVGLKSASLEKKGRRRCWREQLALGQRVGTPPRGGKTLPSGGKKSWRAASLPSTDSPLNPLFFFVPPMELWIFK